MQDFSQFYFYAIGVGEAIGGLALWISLSLVDRIGLLESTWGPPLMLVVGLAIAFPLAMLKFG